MRGFGSALHASSYVVIGLHFTVGLSYRCLACMSDDLELTPSQRELLTTLAEMLRVYGTARFIEKPMVRADAKAFPESWQPTLHAAYALLYRLLWHVYLDIEVEIDDVRTSQSTGDDRLGTSDVRFEEATTSCLRFTVATLARDDIAGTLSHHIGQAFLAITSLSLGYRDVPQTLDERTGSVAAVYLGLGVLAANAASYRLHFSEIVGNSVHSGNKVIQTGGLALDEICFLLVVQDTVREDSDSAAFAGLRPPQKEAVDRWRAELLPHRAALRQLLGLPRSGDEPALVRPPQPRVVAELAEPDFHARNQHHRTFRYPLNRSGTGATLGTFIGGAVGAAGFVATAAPWLLIGGVVVGTVAGLIAGKRRVYFECSNCLWIVTPTMATCPRCGGTIACEIAKRSQRLEKEEELAALDADHKP